MSAPICPALLASVLVGRPPVVLNAEERLVVKCIGSACVKWVHMVAPIVGTPNGRGLCSDNTRGDAFADPALVNP